MTFFVVYIPFIHFINNFIAGDLGQSYDSNQTLNHYELNPTKGKDVLFVGDLSYVDNYPNHDNTR